MDNRYTLGSLFDGSGGFPLAAVMCGIEPIWASEIDPFCISVTSKRFPKMKHLGDITKINGAEIPPVDIITFGSPCQDMSIAGKRAGLDGNRSCLFMDAVRIIKEMRGKTNGKYPKYVIWENVPGAFSSNKGEDFRKVLEELIGIEAAGVSIPKPYRNKWSKAGYIVGRNVSLAWRVLDAQFWGVPQRRKRIFLVADFTGNSAAEILFKRDGLRGDFTESGTARKAAPAPAEICSGTSDERTPKTLKIRCGRDGGGKGALVQENKSATLSCANDQVLFVPQIVVPDKGNSNNYDTLIFDGTQITSKTNRSNPQINAACHTLSAQSGSPILCASFFPQRKAEGIAYQDNNISNTLVNGSSAGFHNAVLYDPELVLNDQGGNSISIDYGTCPTLRAQTHGNEPCVLSNTFCIAGNTIDRKEMNGGNGKGFMEELSYTLNTIDRHAVMQDNDVCLYENHGKDCRYKGPVEVAPTLSAVYGTGGNNTPFAVNAPHSGSGYIVRRITPLECCRLQGFPDWWCADIPHKDTPEYRMWGNGVALPCILYVMEGIADTLNK